MASSHRLGETGLSQSGPSSNHHNIPFAVPHHGINPTTSNPFMNQGGSSFDFGELEQAIVLQGVKIGHHEAKSSLFGARPAATLEMFPSWPMRFQQTNRGSSKSGGESTTDDSGSAINTFSSSQAETHHLEQPESPMSRKPTTEQQQQQQQQNQQQQQQQACSFQQHQQHQQPGMASDASRTGISQKQPQEKRQGGIKSDKVLDAKTLRRLAQNREAARKSRLRKKAYVQQLESSRIKLAQLEQDLQRARAQGYFLGGGGGAPANLSSDGAAGAAIFDMEYARWLEDDHRHTTELRGALQAHLSDGDLRIIVDGYINHYDEIFRLKGVAAKSDIFHLITGMWTTPAERCFLWMGGFRPSELIKMLTAQLDPLTEQQLMGIYSLQHSSQQAEEALSQGLEQLQQSLVDTIATSTVTDGMHQMAIALGKLSNLEGFIRQADNLRQQTLHQLRRILTIRQAARCFLVIGEYYGRLRALSSLWSSRPREHMMSNDNGCQTAQDLQMVQPHQQNHFSPF
ncbi:transcription factor TGA9 isoform X1 [Beta vulgaris subsp. vulgaris]|uniref:transcription factor TGA9 isoform X1 n=1 Tax=Beta vulgaris subsp. vulgaris TaxID=3555 RepID=UPI002036DAFB|nr:transcription factor TGA9 isoform X1 [Beta vulgaris subsp. vulgaris]XP_010686012.2 transcription factor TGA9 isoform X1 [Beta vulgaris subsp. vulgaris]